MSADGSVSARKLECSGRHSKAFGFTDSAAVAAARSAIELASCVFILVSGLPTGFESPCAEVGAAASGADGFVSADAACSPQAP